MPVVGFIMPRSTALSDHRPSLPAPDPRGVHSRGGGVLVAALAVASLGNGLFLPLSLVFFLALTDVP